jgi:hypothetical protein
MGKWGLHRFYSRDPGIRDLFPPTALLQPLSLQSFLAKYGTVYIKPDREHMGKGIIKAWKTNRGYSYIKVRGPLLSFSSTNALYHSIRRVNGTQPHVVQKAIPLAQIRGRPFDIRVMMLRNAGGAWQYAGMLSKVAGPNSVITNILRGHGYALKLEPSLMQSLHFKPAMIASIKRRLIELSYKICKRFDRYKLSSQIGIDFAIDQHGRLWVIEVNFDFPSHNLFARLEDKTFFHNIKRIVAGYRRVYKKKK